MRGYPLVVTVLDLLHGTQEVHQKKMRQGSSCILNVIPNAGIWSLWKVYIFFMQILHLISFLLASALSPVGFLFFIHNIHTEIRSLTVPKNDSRFRELVEAAVTCSPFFELGHWSAMWHGGHVTLRKCSSSLSAFFKMLRFPEKKKKSQGKWQQIVPLINFNW